MNTNRSTRRWMTAGFVIGLACMVTLFIIGVVSGSAPMMVVASSSAAALGASMAAALTATKKIAALS